MYFILKHILRGGAFQILKYILGDISYLETNFGEVQDFKTLLGEHFRFEMHVKWDMFQILKYTFMWYFRFYSRLLGVLQNFKPTYRG